METKTPLTPLAETPLESREPFRIRYLRLVKSNANFRRL